MSRDDITRLKTMKGSHILSGNACRFDPSKSSAIR